MRQDLWIEGKIAKIGSGLVSWSGVELLGSNAKTVTETQPRPQVPYKYQAKQLVVPNACKATHLSTRKLAGSHANEEEMLTS